MKMQHIFKVDRPREKLACYGPDKLSNSELLAIILRTGIKGLNVLELSECILKKFGTLGITERTFEELKTVPGLGPTKAAEIVACFELGKRLLKGKKSALLLTPHEVWSELRDIRNHKKEHFVIFYLDSKNQVIKQEVISIGTLNSSLVHPREVFEPAIANNAAQIIIAHNHPSGNLDPSHEDIQITKRLVESGTLLGIEVVDHVIVSATGWKSLKESGVV